MCTYKNALAYCTDWDETEKRVKLFTISTSSQAKPENSSNKFRDEDL